MSLAVTAGCGFTLNHLQAQQAAFSKYSEAQTKVDAVKANWKQMGLGAFCNLASDPTTKVNIAAGQATPGQTDASNTQDYIIQVITTIECRPFVNVPFALSVPGLNAPVKFVFVSDRVLENPDDANS